MIIISSQQRHRRMLEEKSGDDDAQQFSVIGTTDNIIVGMSMIEELKPHIVVMLQFMTFMNADDFIRRIKAKGLHPRFIIICSNMDEYNERLSTYNMVSCGIDIQELCVERLKDALHKAAVDCRRTALTGTSPPSDIDFTHWYDHQVDLAKFFKGKRTNPNPSELFEWFSFDAAAPYWILLASFGRSSEYRDDLDLSLRDWYIIDRRLKSLFDEYGGGAIGLISEGLYVVILSSEIIIKPKQFDRFAKEMNHNLFLSGSPPFVFDTLDRPDRLDNGASTYIELCALHKYRFFFDTATILRKQMIAAAGTETSRIRVQKLIDRLPHAVYETSEEVLSKIIAMLFQNIKETLSFEFFTRTWNHILRKYTEILLITKDITEKEIDCQITRQFDTIDQYRAEAERMFGELLQIIQMFGKEKNALVFRAKLILQQTFLTNPSLTSIAEELHVNPSYLSRLFAKETGITFINYLNSLKIAEAKKLLSSGGRIDDAAQATGFLDTKYFSKVFKRITGKTPQEYKKEIKSQS